MFMRLFSLCPRRGREFSSRNVKKFLFNCPGVTRFAKNIKFFVEQNAIPSLRSLQISPPQPNKNNRLLPVLFVLLAKRLKRDLN